MDYSIRLTFAFDQFFDNDQLDDLATQLDPYYSASVSYGSADFTVQLFASRRDDEDRRFDTVLRETINDVATSALEVGLSKIHVVEATIMEWQRFEQQLKEPTFPAIVGVSELADLLGVSKARASELARFEGFPAPFAMLKSGPVWIESNVKDFAETWVRKPGRPRKLSPEDAAALSNMGRTARSWDKEDMSNPANDLGFPG